MAFSLNKKQVTLGLDIGHSSTKVVKVLHGGSKPILEFCDELKVSSGDATYLGKLQNLLTKNNLNSLPTATCLEHSSLKIRKIELPKMPEADLKEAVKFKMRDVMEGPVEEYVVRYSSLDDQDTSKIAKRINVVGYAIKKLAVSELTQFLGKINIRPSFIEPSVVSLSNIIEQNHPSHTEWVAGIDLGASKALMVINGQGRFFFSRPLTGVYVEGQTDGSFNQKLAVEIQRTLDTFAVTFRVENIHRIFLCGGGASLDGTIDYLRTNLGIASEILNPLGAFEVSDAMQKKIQDTAYLYALALSVGSLKLKT